MLKDSFKASMEIDFTEEERICSENDNFLVDVESKRPSAVEVANQLFREPVLSYSKQFRLPLWKYLLKVKDSDVAPTAKLLECLKVKSSENPLDPATMKNESILQMLKSVQNDFLRKSNFYEGKVFNSFNPKSIPLILPHEFKCEQLRFYHDATLIFFATAASKIDDFKYSQSLLRFSMILLYVTVCHYKIVCVKEVFLTANVFAELLIKLNWPRSTQTTQVQIVESRMQLESFFDLDQIEKRLKNVSIDVFIFNLQGTLFTDCFKKISDAAKVFDLLLIFSLGNFSRSAELFAVVAYFHIKLPEIVKAETLEEFSNSFNAKLEDSGEFLRLLLLFMKQTTNVKTYAPLFA